MAFFHYNSNHSVICFVHLSVKAGFMWNPVPCPVLLAFISRLVFYEANVSVIPISNGLLIYSKACMQKS